MKLKISDLWRWEGTIDRGAYLLRGMILFAAKFSLDRSVSWLMFDREWSVIDYVRAGALPWRAFQASEDRVYWLTLLALALPFLWAGTGLTLRRLRSAGLPLWLTVLFVVPVVKLIFFALLCLLPSSELVRQRPLVTGDLRGWLGLMIPSRPLGSAVFGIFLALLLAIGTVWLGTTVLRDYGWSLFVGLPFCMGLAPVLIYGCHEPRSWRSCCAVVICTVCLAGLGLLLLAFEGLICLLMAAPLAFAMALVGGAVGYKIQATRWWSGQSPHLFSVMLLAMPAIMGLEHVESPAPPLLEVNSAVEVDALPEAVWKQVVAFPELARPDEWLFRLGIAYPVRAEIRGQGPGALRFCQFSTGCFVEPITVWDAPRRLKFSVSANPAPMKEWTPYHQVHPPHLQGFLEAKGGQFLLTPLPGGRTRLEGTTWYHHHLWPAIYWRCWSNAIIHRIHLRVLNHVKKNAEASVLPPPRSWPENRS